MIRLVVSDLDGTLLPRGEQKLGAEFWQAYAEIRRKGIAFAVASGRSYHELKRFFDPLGDEISYIASDGALLLHGGTCCCHCPISQKNLREALRYTKTHGIRGVVFSGKYLSYYYATEQGFAEIVRKSLHQHALSVLSTEEIKEPIYKLSFFEQNADALSLERFAEGLSKIYEGSDWVDYVDAAAEKGIAARHLMELLSVSADEVAVFGDNENDIGMLSVTKNSFATAGAKQKVKDAAKYTTDDVAATMRKLGKE